MTPGTAVPVEGTDTELKGDTGAPGGVFQALIPVADELSADTNPFIATAMAMR